MLTVIRRGSLPKQVVAYLFDAILQGELSPGHRIVEGKLAKQLGVAQNTLREGLHELEHQGLVVKYDGRGTYVTKFTLKQVEDIYAVRLQLEPLAASLAPRSMGPEHFSRLESLLERMRAAGERGDFLEVSKADLAFHQSLWKLSGNEALEKALNTISIPLFAFYAIRLYSGAAYHLERLQEEHCSLLAVLKKGPAGEIEKAFKEKLEAFRMQHVETMRVREIDPSPRAGQSREGQK